MGNVGVGGMGELSRGNEVFVTFFREFSENLRLERLRVRLSFCSEAPAKLVVALCPSVRVTAAWIGCWGYFEMP